MACIDTEFSLFANNFMATTKQVWFGMKVTPEQKRRIEGLARRRGTSQKAVVLAAIERELYEEEYPDPQPGSFLEAAWDFVGRVDGPPDLLREPDHMEGYGQ